MASAFRYDRLLDALNTIRQMVLLPAVHRNEIVRCELKIVSLEDVQLPSYEALSYCWGNPAATKRTIFLNGCTFQVTLNLHAALLQLRRSHEPRTLWIDAICINQANDLTSIEERSAQVSLMQKIYARCERVLVWLGEADESTSLAFSAIQRSAARFGKEPGYIMRADSRWEWRNKRSRTQSSLLRGAGSALRGTKLSDHFRDDPGLALQRLVFTRPWFSRIWVVQEIAVAPKATVICGGCEIEWEEIELMNRMTPLRLPHLERLVAIREVYQNDTISAPGDPLPQWWAIEKLDLARLVTVNRACGVSDPRDRIYAMWGMVDKMMGDEGTFSIKPDYRIQEQELFKKFTLAYLRSTKRLDMILTRSAASDLVEPDWPSWIWQGKYSIKVDPAFYSIFTWPSPGSDTSWEFNATLDSVGGNFETSVCGKFLRCSGYAIAHVEQVGLPRPEPSINTLEANETRPTFREMVRTFFASLVCMISWYHIAMNSSDNGIYMETGEACRDVLWQLCCAYVPYSEYFETMDNYEGFEQAIDPFLRLSARFRKSYFVIFLLLLWQAPYLLISSLWKGRSDSIGRAQEFVKISGLSCNRVLFQADGGEHKLLGIGQINVLEGDTIVLLQGARVPVVLRQRQIRSEMKYQSPRQDSGSEDRNITKGSFTLIGECLIHGIMYGEMYDPKICHDIWIE